MEEPVRFLVENTDMARNLFLAARTAGVKKLLNLGSSCMYPRNAINPIKESALLSGELEPTNEAYALAKIYSQRLCDYISASAPDLSYKTVIPCNLFGRWDHFDVIRSHMIPAVIMKIYQAKEANSDTVTIWGDGTARREFMYAGDLADFIFAAIQRFDELPSLINVGLGHDYSINEYYVAISQVVGYQGSFEHDLTQPVGVKQKLVDVEKLNAFGWQARTSLEQGIAEAFDYYLGSIQV
jgi:GDP-L-fucose synthase